MLNSLFQNSKSALIFAGVVVVTALTLVGPKDGGGMLDKAVSTSKEERGKPANNAAMPGNEMSGAGSAPYTYQGNGSDLGELNGAETAMVNPPIIDPIPGRAEARMTPSDLSQEPALPPGMAPDGAPSMRNAIIPPPDAVMQPN
jgi:hypothetical protein